MILDEMLKILKKQTEDKAYTVNGRSYTYAEFYKYICNIYNFLILENKEKKPIIIYGNKDIYMKYENRSI